MFSSCCLLSDLRRCIHSVLSEMSSSCCLIWAEQMSVHVISQLETRQATAGLLIIKGWFVSTIDNQILMRPAKWKVPTLNYPYFCYMPPLHEERMKTNRKLIVYSVLGTWSFWHLHSPGSISPWSLIGFILQWARFSSQILSTYQNQPKNGITDACSTADCCPLLSIVDNMPHAVPYMPQMMPRHAPDDAPDMPQMLSQTWPKHAPDNRMEVSISTPSKSTALGC